MSWGNLLKTVRPFSGPVLDEETRCYVNPFVLNNGEIMTSRKAASDDRNIHNLSSGTLQTRMSRGGKWLDPDTLWSPPNPKMSRASKKAKKNRK